MTPNEQNLQPLDGQRDCCQQATKKPVQQHYDGVDLRNERDGDHVDIEWEHCNGDIRWLRRIFCLFCFLLSTLKHALNGQDAPGEHGTERTSRDYADVANA